MGSGILAPVSVTDVCVSGVTVLGANAAPQTPLQFGDLVTVQGTCLRVRPGNEAVLTSSLLATFGCNVSAPQLNTRASVTLTNVPAWH